MMKMLSKSKLKLGHQCQKYLYLSVNNPELEDVLADNEKKFKIGHQVDEIAKKEFPNGISVNTNQANHLKLIETQELMKMKRPIFEASFEYDGIIVQVDILDPMFDDDKSFIGWHVIEVKSGTSAKPEYIFDIAIQEYVLRNAGVQFNQISLWHINNQTKTKDALFTKKFISIIELLPFQTEIEDLIDECRKTLKQESAPSCSVGSHCDNPYKCPFKSHCFKDYPTESTIFNIPNFRNKWKAFKDGHVSVTKENAYVLVNKYKADSDIINTIVNDENKFNAEEVGYFLDSLTYPVSSLDFEAIASAIPLWIGTRPYQQIPFQYSLHVLHRNGNLDKKGYLHQTNSDPRLSFIISLLEDLPKYGSILSYNKAFESMVLNQLSKDFPSYHDDLQAIVFRLVDPLPLVRKNLYIKDFGASFSLKSIVPALFGASFDYKLKDIKNGVEAQDSFIELINETDSKKKYLIAKQMQEYCDADVHNLILLINYLEDMCKKHSGQID